MTTKFECIKDELEIKGYYKPKLGDYLCFYNSIGTDIQGHLPHNPFTKSNDEYYKHKCYEELKNEILSKYNYIKIAVKENCETTEVVELKLGSIKLRIYQGDDDEGEI